MLGSRFLDALVLIHGFLLYWIKTPLAEKIRTLFRKQGITIASILTAIGMAIRVLVEALLPGGGVPQHQVGSHLLKMRKV